MRIDPLLDFTFTTLPAENVPEISCIHSLPEWYRRGLGLCATAAWLAKRKPAEKNRAAKITVASCRCFLMVALFVASIQVRHARQVTLRFLPDIFVRVALRQHG